LLAIIRKKLAALCSNRRLLPAASLAVLVSVLAVAGYLIRMIPVHRATQTVSPSVVLPAKPAAESQAQDVKLIVATFGKNETITTALQQLGLSSRQVYEFVKSTLPVYNLAKVKAGQQFKLNLTPDGMIRDFLYPVDDDRYLTVSRENDRFVPAMKKFAYEIRTESVSGSIDESLFLAVTDSGEQEKLALDLADIFMWDVDFYTDIQKGDSFRMLVQKEYLDGKFVKYGPILAAVLNNQHKDIMGFRFVDENGAAGYYGPDGKSLKKSFLKSPLKFARISSGYSTARMHPILKTVRPHLGVDYAAPVGTPVIAVGSGTVEFAGDSGGGGRTVKLRHAGSYETYYLHLSRIAVRSGNRVAQGEVIGYVGATGLATGPHLDFRVLFHGKFTNPTKVVFPPAPPVSESSFTRFAVLRDELEGRLEHISF
jgi:murein DD-endopeptidase MepM/ murein hydrolase activator NlpD